MPLNDLQFGDQDQGSNDCIVYIATYIYLHEWVEHVYKVEKATGCMSFFLGLENFGILYNGMFEQSSHSWSYSRLY